jgi:uncharacterized protein
MDQRISLITLGVADVARARAFYEALGWRRGGPDLEEVAFFQCGGMVLGLWSRTALAADRRAGGDRLGAPTDWGGYSGVFHDPDGHPWEVAHNPGWPLADDGSVRLE